MSNSNPDILQQFKPSKIILPILIGLGVTAFFIWKNIGKADMSVFEWTNATVIGLIIAILMLVVRDLAYMWRIRVLTDYQLTWKRSFVVILLWEFASAVTPSIVGGTAFAFFLLAKEKINVGKTTAIVLLTAFLDELFYVLMVPLFLLLVSYSAMFSFLDNAGTEMGENWMSLSLITAFWFGYFVLFAYTMFLAYGLFINPQVIRKLIHWIFRWNLLKRWREGAMKAGDDVIVASQELKGKAIGFWAKAFGSTVLTWTARYFIINALLFAFAYGHQVDHFIAFSRQIFMWVVLLIPVSPGGAGIAETIFGPFLGDFINPAIDPTFMALFWRLIGYYPFLVIGAFLLPRWVRNKFSGKNKD